MKTKSYDFYSDPGHGWLRVTRKELDSLGLSDRISHYSYVRGDYVYLEQDVDLDIFFYEQAMKGIEVKINYHSTNKQSRIRNYDSYSKPRN